MDEDYLLPFQFSIPLRKSRSEESHHGEKLWGIEGVAATDKIDQQKEKLLLRGMDFSPLLKSGVLNFDHLDGPENIIGEPTSAKVIEKSSSPSLFYVNGWLYKHVPRAQAVWNHLQELEKGAQPITRKYGFSVQGGVLERKDNELTKSVVRHLAVTHQPVNTDTFAKCVSSLVKSLQQQGVTYQQQNTLDPKVMDIIFAPCRKGCMDKTGLFKSGHNGMLDHLVLCNKVPVSEAKKLVLLMVKQ